MKLGILEFGVVTPGVTPSETLRRAVQSAVLLERLGFSRLWFAEHHEIAFSYASPEVLIPAAAAITKRIRVGSAGVLLQLHSPLRVAEVFRSLEALFPGRIDMGLSAGITGDHWTQQALNENFHPDLARFTQLYARKVEQLLMMSRNQYPPGHRFEKGPSPLEQASPPAWLLGGGPGVGNMILAAKFGARFCYSLVHGDSRRGTETLQEYRNQFQASEELSAPEASIAASILCGETERETEVILQRFKAWQKDPVVSIVGTPKQCHEQVLGLRDRFGCDEVILIPAFDRLDDRERGYTMLADAFHLCR
jgi:luciferase family oxidoreductase group 1